MLRIADDGRLLETETGLTMRLGETVFGNDGRYAGIDESAVSEQPLFGFPNRVVDFEIAGLDPGGKTYYVHFRSRDIFDRFSPWTIVELKAP